MPGLLDCAIAVVIWEFVSICDVLGKKKRSKRANLVVNYLYFLPDQTWKGFGAVWSETFNEKLYDEITSLDLQRIISSNGKLDFNY